jgi:hypothetical protein
MVYNMLNPTELEKFRERTTAMVGKAKKMQNDFYNDKFFVVELKERQPSRTIQQNAYLWVTITYVAIEEGYTKDYIEQEFKRVNKDVFLRERENKRGEKFQYWRHIPDLDKQEMSECIDRWLHHCSMERGLYIPSPQDHAYLVWQTKVERDAELNKEYL